jgi:hypothetical protein
MYLNVNSIAVTATATMAKTALLALLIVARVSIVVMRLVTMEKLHVVVPEIVGITVVMRAVLEPKIVIHVLPIVVVVRSVVMQVVMVMKHVTHAILTVTPLAPTAKVFGVTMGNIVLVQDTLVPGHIMMRLAAMLIRK